jgi:hypothetical protein
MPDDLKDEIGQNEVGPAKVSGDAGSTEQHKLTEQIAAEGVGDSHFIQELTESLPGAFEHVATETRFAHAHLTQDIFQATF